jgi:Na+-transporting NADH:ubiquinone oxidoreductase subunit NqrE
MAAALYSTLNVYLPVIVVEPVLMTTTWFPLGESAVEM